MLVVTCGRQRQIMAPYSFTRRGGGRQAMQARRRLFPILTFSLLIPKVAEETGAKPMLLRSRFLNYFISFFEPFLQHIYQEQFFSFFNQEHSGPFHTPSPCSREYQKHFMCRQLLYPSGSSSECVLWRGKEGKGEKLQGKKE